MTMLGVLLTLGAAAAFAVVAGLLVWGGEAAAREARRPGAPTHDDPPAARTWAWVGLYLPLALAALLALLAALQIARVGVDAAGGGM